MTTDFRFYLNRQGIQGRKGEQGEQGYSPTITVKSQTANEYVLTVQNEDGSFDTPNLRGNAIENRGGTYIRYNPNTEEMYTGDADLASTQKAGVVFLSTYEQLIAGGSENLVPTSQDVYNFVNQQIISGFVTQQEFDTYTAATAITLNNLSTQKLSFADLSNAIVAGSNITLSVDSENNTITINATGGDLTNYVTLDTAQTITGGKTFKTPALTTLIRDSGFYFEQNAYTGRLSIGANVYGGVKRGGIIASQGLGAIIGTQGDENKSSSIFIPYNCDNPIILKGLNRPEPLSNSDVDAGYPIWNESIVSAGSNISINTIGTGRDRRYELSAVSPDLSNYVTLNTSQTVSGQKGFTSMILASGGISLPTGNSINFHSPTTGSAGFISSPSANTLQIRANTININSGGSSPIVKNLFDMIRLSDLSIASTSLDWLNYNNSTGEFSANVDVTVTQNSNNLITSDAVYNGLATKQNVITDLSSIRSGAELGSTSEQLENKVSSIDSTSSDTEYPSAKCVYDNLETKADTELSNLSTNGNSKLHAIKGYYEELNQLNDIEGFSYYKNNLRSTFDLSKFTVVGSPVITDDGIASGFSSSNYISIPNINLGNSFNIYQYVTVASVTQQYLFAIRGDRYLQLQLRSNNKLSLEVGSGGDSWTYTGNGTTSLAVSSSYYLHFYYANGAYKVDISTDGEVWTNEITIASASQIITGAHTLVLCSQRSLGANFTGSINLKQFSVTVDGVEVFSGNKTGVDIHSINNSTISIPYIETIQGDRIADIQYLIQAQQIYETTGNCDEVILDQTNQVYYLPAGSIYGKMNKKIGNIETLLNNINSGSGS